jgi:hypothetical protein
MRVKRGTRIALAKASGTSVALDTLATIPND